MLCNCFQISPRAFQMMAEGGGGVDDPPPPPCLFLVTRPTRFLAGFIWKVIVTLWTVVISVPVRHCSNVYPCIVDRTFSILVFGNKIVIPSFPPPLNLTSNNFRFYLTCLLSTVTIFNATEMLVLCKRQIVLLTFGVYNWINKIFQNNVWQWQLKFSQIFRRLNEIGEKMRHQFGEMQFIFENKCTKYKKAWYNK